MNNLFRLYNQNIEYFTRNACAIYVWFHIFQIMFGIKVKNNYIVAASKKAEKDKAWWSGWGTYADTIANWFEKEVKERFGVGIDIKIHSGYSDTFEKNLKNGYAYGIGLKYAGRLYKNIIKDKIIKITELDVDLKEHKIYGHFLTYFYSKKTKKYYILDSLGKNKKPIEMSIKVFRKGMDNGIFFINCRTVELENPKLDYYLKFLKNGGVVKNVESLNKINRKALDKALELRSLTVKK